MEIYIVFEEDNIINKSNMLKAFKNIDDAREYIVQKAKEYAEKNKLVNTGLLDSERVVTYVYREGEDEDIYCDEIVVLYSIYKTELV